LPKKVVNYFTFGFFFLLLLLPLKNDHPLSFLKGEGPTGKESKNALKEGWLTKQGNYIKNWRPRWFQLKDGILYYYKDPQIVCFSLFDPSPSPFSLS